MPQDIGARKGEEDAKQVEHQVTSQKPREECRHKESDISGERIDAEPVGGLTIRNQSDLGKSPVTEWC